MNFMKPLAVPVLGGVGHEIAEIELRIAAHRLVMHDVGVVVEVGHSGIGDGVVFSRDGAGVVAVDDGVNLMTVEQALHRRDDVVGALLLAVLEDRRQRAAEDATHQVDFLAGKLEPALERETVGGGPARERHAAADRDGFALGADTVVDVGKETARHCGGAETGESRTLHEVPSALEKALARALLFPCSAASDDHGRLPPFKCAPTLGLGASYILTRSTVRPTTERASPTRRPRCPKGAPLAVAQYRPESARLRDSSQLGVRRLSTAHDVSGLGSTRAVRFGIPQLEPCSVGHCGTPRALVRSFHRV